MKKLLLMTLCLVLVFTFAACGKATDGAANASDTKVFTATIIEVHEGSYLIEPVEGSDELMSSDRFDVPIKNMDASREPVVGDSIEITYSGDILETYPAGLGNVIGIKLIDNVNTAE